MSADERDKRLRSSVLVEQGEEVVIIDTGPDFRQQMLRTGSTRLHAVLFTHEHRDHVAGLDDIRAFNYLQKSPMDVYAEARVLRALNISFPYVFAEKQYPGIPRVRMHEISTDPFPVGEIDVVPIRLMHYRLSVLGFRMGDFAYLTDANYIPEAEKKKLSGVKYLVVNALRREIHISHFNLAQAVSLIQEISPQMGYLTHISHQMGTYADLEKDLPSGIRPAYDGLVLEL